MFRCVVRYNDVVVLGCVGWECAVRFDVEWKFKGLAVEEE